MHKTIIITLIGSFNSFDEVYDNFLSTQLSIHPELTTSQGFHTVSTNGDKNDTMEKIDEVLSDNIKFKNDSIIFITELHGKMLKYAQKMHGFNKNTKNRGYIVFGHYKKTSP